MTTSTSSDTEFSYRLTESLLTRKTSSTLSTSQRLPTLSHQQNTPRIITTQPPNAMVMKEKNSNSSFREYIGNHFEEHAPVFLDRLPTTSAKDRPPDSTFWPFLSNDFDSHRHIDNDDNYTKLEYGSIISEDTSLIATTPKLFSIGAFLFILGFLCPPCWWIGSFYPGSIKRDRKSMDEHTRMALRWRLINRFFSLGFSVLLLIAIIILVIIYTKIE